jgi:cytochrome c peroxidase
MDAGQFATVVEVLDHYNHAPDAPAGETALEPLGLGRGELRQLEALLRSLNGGTAVQE